MTPKEKAEELFNKYLEINYHYYQARDCALIAIEEVLDFMMNDDKESKTCYWANHPLLSYWYEVKKEIELL
jgi:hypothetical protein